MQLRTLIVGIAVTAILVVVLGVTRLMGVAHEEKVYELEKIETISLEAPEEPVEQPEEVEEDVTPPPPPAFEDLSVSVDLDIPAIPHSEARFDPKMQVEMFSSDIAPAELPVAKVAPNPVAKPSPSKPKSPVVKPKAKSSYSLGELDSSPRNIRQGRFTWPRGVKERSVTAVVYVELDEKGRCKLIKIKSISNSKFNAVISRVVSGSRFTPPTRDGMPVKSRFDWPLTLKKP